MAWSDYEKAMKMASAVGGALYSNAKRKVATKAAPKKAKVSQPAKGLQAYHKSVMRTKKALEDFERENQ